MTIKIAIFYDVTIYERILFCSVYGNVAKILRQRGKNRKKKQNFYLQNQKSQLNVFWYKKLTKKKQIV